MSIRRVIARTGAALAAVVVLGLTAAAPAAFAANPSLGPNVMVFDPSMATASIQSAVDAVYAQQVDDEMGTHRYALLFKPGTYGAPGAPLIIKVGYYTDVAGLGMSPADTTIVGKVDVYNRCLAPDNCIALNNFWRSVSNLTIHLDATGQDGCRASADFWAVSQGASMRDVRITGGNLSLMDYCSAGPQYASGGFIGDSDLPLVINGSQQQWLTRNSHLGGWSNAVWNQVFAGVDGAPTEDAFPNPPYTTLDTTPASREKPYLFVDANGNYNVRVPSAHANSSNYSWAGGPAAGKTIEIKNFFVASPATSVQTINQQLASGKNLLLTPGVYSIGSSIQVKRADTVVLGLGEPTLTAANGTTLINVGDVKGVIVAGLILDAGSTKSATLLKVGSGVGNAGSARTSASDPTTLSDVYVRVGGPHVGQVDTAVTVNSDNVLLDNVWIWRADHGAENFPAGTNRWTADLGRNGLVVNGSNVSATGLFVEHFQQYNTVWNGQHGTTVMYQSELAYDAPSQADWSHDGVNGWAGYKVADSVTSHNLYGGGVYVFNNVEPSIHTENGFEVPDVAGVSLHHIMTVNLSAGTIDHVVNDTGAPADTSAIGVPSFVTDYP